MTIAVVWQEHQRQWCAADTRLVAGSTDRTVTDIASKVFSIPVVVHAMPEPTIVRAPHSWTEYGFVFAGSASPAAITAATASTLLQKLARPGDRMNPPTFEEVAEFVRRLAAKFMQERRHHLASRQDQRQHRDDGLFSAAFLGWCPYAQDFKVARIDGKDDSGSFRVELSFSERPEEDGEPWLVLGSGAASFKEKFEICKADETHRTSMLPLRAIEKMVAEDTDPTVGGSTSIGMAYENRFQLFYRLEPSQVGEPHARRTFNGLDLDFDVGKVGEYFVAIDGLA